MKILVEGDPKTGGMFWRSEDSSFYGALLPAFTLTPAEGDEMPMPAGALLSVPKYGRYDRPSINKYSPLIVQAPTVDLVVKGLEAWTDQNSGKALWKLRTQ
jgi:hypothetical protein